VTKSKPKVEKKKGAKMRKVSTTLTEKERKVLEAFEALDAIPEKTDSEGKPIYVALKDLAGEAFAKKGTSPQTKGNSWVRNSMRKLLKMKLVKHKGGKSGLYTRTSAPIPAPTPEETKAKTESAAA